MQSLFKPMDRKGNIFAGMQAIFLGLASLAILGIVVFLVLAELGANATVAADTNATNAVNTLQEAGDSVVDWVDIAVIVSIGVMLFGMVGYLWTKK